MPSTLAVNSFLSRAKSVVRSFGKNKGQDLPPDRLLPTLLEDLRQALGEPIPQNIKIHPVGSYSTRTFAVKPNEIRAVSKVLSELDFTVSPSPITKYVGGTRLEINRKTTVVNYCGLSGILVISTTLSIKD